MTDDFLLKMSPTDKICKWWPVFAQPIMLTSCFERGMSPVGRLATFVNEGQFRSQFQNKNVTDFANDTLFTTNSAFWSMYTNINTLFYDKNVLISPLCQLNKYLVYNTKAATNLNNCRKYDARQNAYNGKHNNQTTESAVPTFNFDTDFARATAIAFPKRCWTTQEILKQENKLRKPCTYQTRSVVQSDSLDNHFFIVGQDALEKFDVGIPYCHFSMKLRLERQEDDVFICASKQKLDHTQTDPLSYRTIPRSSLHNLVHYIFTAHDFNRVEFTLRDSRTDIYMYVIDMLKRSTKTYS